MVIKLNGLAIYKENLLGNNFVSSGYTKMPDFYPTKRATKGYVTGWGKRLNDRPALWSRHRYDIYYESWLRKELRYSWFTKNWSRNSN